MNKMEYKYKQNRNSNSYCKYVSRTFNIARNLKIEQNKYPINYILGYKL